jgi:signal transduction histidine kinase
MDLSPWSRVPVARLACRGVTADLGYPVARALHPEVEVTLLRVAQEALANVAKHAGASRAGVTLSYIEDVVSLDVRDDGTGFVPPAGSAAPAAPNGSLSAGGFGLIAMRQRVSRLAGQLEIESEPGAGTAVSASLPAIPLGPSPQTARSGSPPGIRSASASSTSSA